MKIIVGLGNPGEKYKNTRHNVGFMAVERIYQKYKSNIKYEMKLKSELVDVEIDGEKIILMKPMTFMNGSGEAVAAVLKMYKDKVSLADLWVIHDDIDLILGKIKIQKGGGSAGHRGIESIIQAMGNNNFVRFRMGIGPKAGEAEKFVLEPFASYEQPIVKEMIKKTVEAIFMAIDRGIERTMNLFN